MVDRDLSQLEVTIEPGDGLLSPVDKCYVLFISRTQQEVAGHLITEYIR